MMEEKIILYGAGRFGLLALKRYGTGRVAFFCDSYSEETEIENIPVIRPHKMIECCKADASYHVIITPGNFDIRREMAKPLIENGIGFSAFERNDRLTGGSRAIHIRNEAGSLRCDYKEDDIKGFERRVPLTYGLFRKMYSRYQSDFAGKEIDLTVFIGDHSLDAYYNASATRTGFVLAYNTVSALEDHVIAIPDYRACYDPEDYAYEETPERCQKAAEKAWEDPRIVWKGNITSDDSRSWLEILAHKYPEILYVDDPVNDKSLQFVPMTEFARYKYLLDIRGYGWSDRLKILLQLGRPVFLVERPFKEWYTDRLIPWTHYIPVKDDMSDLISNYRYMEEHPEKYDEIVRNMKVFAEENLLPDAVLKYTRDVVLKYGVITEDGSKA